MLDPGIDFVIVRGFSVFRVWFVPELIAAVATRISLL